MNIAVINILIHNTNLLRVLADQATFYPDGSEIYEPFDGSTNPTPKIASH
jgi:hypothetical protein